MEKFTFFNDVDDDRIYFAEDFARHLAAFFTNGIFNNGCKVLGENDDMSVNVSKGSANINGYRYDNDAIKVLNIDNADGVLNRIDNVVIRWNLTDRTITAQVIKGTFAANPVAPALVRSSTTYDLRIAKISVPAGTTTITADLITDTRFITSDCGDVISTVQTPDTEGLFTQIQAIFTNTIADMNSTFDEWFNKIKNQLDEDAAGKLANNIYEIVRNDLKSSTCDLIPENWVLNDSTNSYEYDIIKSGITSNTFVTVNLDIDNQNKLNNGYVDSYDGGFKIITSELPNKVISITYTYKTANMELEGSGL